jgi:hypothetical protein
MTQSHIFNSMQTEPNPASEVHAPTKDIETDNKCELEDAFQNLHLTFTSQELDLAHIEIERYKQKVRSYQRHIAMIEKELKKKNSDLSKVRMDCSLANAEKDVLKKEVVSLRESKGSIQDCVYQFSPGQGDDPNLIQTRYTPVNNVGILKPWNNHDILYHRIEREMQKLSQLLEMTPKKFSLHVSSKGINLFKRCILFCVSRKKVNGAYVRTKWPWKQTGIKYERILDDCDSITVFSDEPHLFKNIESTQNYASLSNLMKEFHNFDKNQRRYIKSLEDCVGIQNGTIIGLQNEITRLVSLHISNSFPVSVMEGHDDFNYEVVLNGEEKMERCSI